jgi:hypothetical protein
MAAGSTAVAASSARPSRNMGAAQRAQAALRRAPARSNRLVAIEARCDPHTIRRVRRNLEQAGLIPATTTRTQRTPPPRKPGRTRLAMLAGAITTAEIQAIAGVSRSAIYWARHHPPPRPPLPGRACGPLPLGDPEFPVGWERESDAAVRICLTYCPCLAACRAWAMTQPHLTGVVGGMTQAQRRGTGPLA